MVGYDFFGLVGILKVLVAKRVLVVAIVVVIVSHCYISFCFVVGFIISQGMSHLSDL